MSRKVFCDGCDREMNPKPVVTINVMRHQEDLADIESCDICDSCLAGLLDKIDPRKWPRVDKGPRQ